MKFSQVIDDIKCLVGMKLNSIRPGAEITIIEVDEEHGRILVQAKSGEVKSRPFQEIRRIWDELCKKPAVHVESVLYGSGSSRNQPETILANLPYIEWFRYNKKKHIAFVGQATHPPGTLKEMDPVQAEKIKAKLRGAASPVVTSEVVVVTSDVRGVSQALESVAGTRAEPLAPGVYKHECGGTRVFLVAGSSLPGVKEGTYAVIRSPHKPEGGVVVQLGGRTFHVVCAGGLYLMVEAGKMRLE
ncbi:hypothetical protein SAMN00808754_1362 [Thermanaeromonas toyohensis ToBE]|uniref:Uncharacterized protein n=1 Tax=Thermanaeromonas toyohensis ToBE TaxID=698762 RepID=A0A1W1VST4_9FIRM|nr:hypothetical protein [Thermanaeromonas toyohensis]SMB95944.1 hypothetical protein SAMN00808754_1362 [Thermanaeromonas toyohensis ToBE]